MHSHSEDRTLISTLLSLAIHIGLYFAVHFASQITQDPVERKLMVVELLQPTPVKPEQWTNPENAVVRQLELPEDALSLDAKSKRRFLSEKTQNVKEELKAQANGLTKNRPGQLPTESDSDSNSNAQAESRQDRPLEPRSTADQSRARDSGKSQDDPSRSQRQSQTSTKANPRPDASKRAQDQSREYQTRDEQTDSGSDIVVAQKKFWEESGLRPNHNGKELIFPNDPRRPGMSTVGEVLPEDIRIGNFTSLNTDRFVYYTFYARVEEAIRHRWVNYVKAALYGGQVRTRQTQYISRLEIILDAKGRFIDAIIHESSGAESIDRAPFFAFREAEKIPNPPREMVKADGTIRLHYAFQVDNVPPRQPAQGRAQDRGPVGP